MPPQPAYTELAERGYRAWNEDDLEALLAICHPEVEYHTSGVFPGLEPVYRGRTGIEALVGDVPRALEARSRRSRSESPSGPTAWPS